MENNLRDKDIQEAILNYLTATRELFKIVGQNNGLALVSEEWIITEVHSKEFEIAQKSEMQEMSKVLILASPPLKTLFSLRMYELKDEPQSYDA